MTAASPAPHGLAASIAARDLKSLMATVAGAVEERGPIPVLAHVRLEALGPAGVVSPALRATACNLAWEIAATQPAAGVERPGELLVPGGVLGRVAAKIRPEAEVGLSVARDGFELRLAADRLAVRLPALDGADWPLIRDDSGAAPTTVVLEATALARLLEQVRFAASQDPARPYLNGVLLGHGRAPGTLGAVATDGHRMAVAEVAAEIEGPALAAGDDSHGRGVIVPRGAVAEMARLLAGRGGAARLAVTRRLIVLSLGLPGEAEVRLAAKLLDAQYPDWTRVVPPDGPATEVRVTRGALLAATARVGLVTERGQGMRVAVTGDGVALAARGAATANAADEALAGAATGPAVTVGVNPRFLADIAGAAGGDEIVLGVNGPGDPLLIRGPEAAARFVLMPMRI